VHSAPFINSTTIIPIVAGTIVVVLCVIPLWEIYRRAGFSPWILLLWFVPMAGPLLGLCVLYVVAYSKWRVSPEDQKKPHPQTAVLKLASHHGVDRSGRLYLPGVPAARPTAFPARSGPPASMR
jgi:hypothetical protein